MEGKVLNHEARIILNAGRKEGKIKGRLDGRAESILEILEEYGTVPMDVKQQILTERKIDQLKKWLKLSVQVKSIEQFIEHK